jgi:hypothetical protein
MNRFASATFLVGATLVTAGGALLLFGPVALLAVGAFLIAVGVVASLASYLGSDDKYRAPCPECGTDNWAERTRCRECDAALS